MSAFDVEKAGQYSGGLPQSPVPAATPHHDGEFLPGYEEAVNVNLRNFDQAEGYVSKEECKRNQKANKSRSIWKRCLIFGLPLLLILVALISAGLAVYHYEKHSAGSSSPSSITITKRHTITITETRIFPPSIPPAIAQAASSFYGELVTITSTIMYGNKSVGFSLITTIAPLPSIDMSQVTTTMPLPSINMSPTSSTLDPSTTPLPSINISPTPAAFNPASTTTTSSTSIVSVDPLGDGFCGLPGPFCAGGKRKAAPKAEHAKGDGFCGLPGTPCLGGRDSRAIETERRDKQEEGDGLTTVTKHLTVTTTRTISTGASIPASIIAAENAYYNQWSSTFFSTASSSTQEATSSTSSTTSPSSLPPVTVTVTPNPSPASTKSSESSSFVTCVRGGLVVLDQPCYK